MNDARDKQVLDVLNGSRGGNAIGQAAVRLDDLKALLSIPDKLKATEAAGNPPTQAEYNALLTDVRMLHRHLLGLAAALQLRYRPR